MTNRKRRRTPNSAERGWVRCPSPGLPIPILASKIELRIPQSNRRTRRADRLPAAACEPAIELVQAVMAPERLAIDDKVRRAEHPLGDRLVVHRLQPLFQLRASQGRQSIGAIMPQS